MYVYDIAEIVPFLHMYDIVYFNILTYNPRCFEILKQYF